VADKRVKTVRTSFYKNCVRVTLWLEIQERCSIAGRTARCCCKFRWAP